MNRELDGDSGVSLASLRVYSSVVSEEEAAKVNHQLHSG